MSLLVFQWPAIGALLLFAIPLAWLLARARTQRRLLIDAMGGGHPTHRRRRDVLRVAAFILLVLALARPGYSPQTESTSRSGRDVVFVIDVSQSMLAEDTLPSRLEVAKQGVRDALNTFSNERVGLVVYAGSASILCPLTYDYDFVRYMLDQANTRTVDFGGTMLQAAVEKAVDQVFVDGRDGVQDLIVLTDGGDHGSAVTQTIDLLDKKGIDTLLIGLGSPDQGAPIKLKDDEGNVQLLEYQGSAVYTMLEDAALRAFAAAGPRVEYLPLGTQPFNLGQVYIDYAIDKRVDVTDSENGILVYQEAALFFMVPALLLLLLAERSGLQGRPAAYLFVLSLFALPPQTEASQALEQQFNAASDTLQAGNFEQAETLFAELYQDTDVTEASLNQLATIHFNRGLALVGQANAQDTPQLALLHAQAAQLAFLAAKRSAPALDRASIRLQMTAVAVSELKIQIAAIEAQDEQVAQLMQVLVTRLQTLLAEQTRLRETVIETAKDPQAAQQISALINVQKKLQLETEALQSMMEQIDKSMAVQTDDISIEERLMVEPLRLIKQTQVSQKSAERQLKQLEQWPLAQELQLDAENSIEEILERLASDSQEDPSAGEEWDEMEENYEYTDDAGESMNTSEPMQGDFAAGSEMQELPVPNYSAEDILMEEQGSQQFRQQKRASGNAAKVEKDF